MRIAIVGAGGHGREVLQAARRSSGADPRSPLIEVAGFYDDHVPDQRLLDRLHVGYLGELSAAVEPCLLGIGNGTVRERLDSAVTSAPPIIDPSAVVGDDVAVADGCVVFAQATVTTNIELGRHVHVGRGAAVGHDSVLDDYVSVMPLAAISGDVRIGSRTFIGTGALVRQGVRIGCDVTVGMGAVVLRDVPDGETVIGNPARLR